MVSDCEFDRVTGSIFSMYNRSPEPLTTSDVYLIEPRV